MTPQELQTLEDLLTRFYRECEEEAAASISKASTPEFAAKLERGHSKNLADLKVAIAWVHARRVMQ